MTTIRTGAILLAFALAGCGSEVSLENATIAEVASATDRIERPDAGQWLTRVALTDFDAGGERTPVSEAMKAQVGQEIETDACLSGNDARKPLFGNLSPSEGADCRFARFTFDGGRLESTMTCRNKLGERLEVKQQGSYSATAVDLVSAIRRTGADGKAAGGMTTHLVAKRTGACEVEKAG